MLSFIKMPNFWLKNENNDIVTYVTDTQKSDYGDNGTQNCFVHIIIFCFTIPIWYTRSMISFPASMHKNAKIGLKNGIFRQMSHLKSIRPMVGKNLIPTTILKINWWFFLQNSHKCFIYTSNVILIIEKEPYLNGSW